MKVYAFDWALVPFVDLDHMLRSQVVQLYLLIVRARNDAIPQRMEFHLMNHSGVLLVRLD